MHNGSLEFALTESTCIIMLIGEITWEISTDLDSFLCGILNESTFGEILFDLSKTVYMDSTSLGVLAHIKLKAQEVNISVSLINPTGEILISLQDIGLSKIFEIKQSTITSTAAFKPVPANTNYSLDEITALIHKTHLALVNISDRNRKTFGGIVDAIDNAENPGA